MTLNWVEQWSLVLEWSTTAKLEIIYYHREVHQQTDASHYKHKNLGKYRELYPEG